MIANYHTHTPLCRHAKGTVEEYAQAAFDSGIQILGMSDHTPYWFPEGYYTHMRMFPHQLEGYIQEVLAVKEKFQGRMQIHLGLEVEYYPKYFPELLAHLRDTPVEYFILGQHWCGSEIDEPYNGTPTDREQDVARYCDQVMEALNTGLFTYAAHPDLIHFVGDDGVYRRHVRRLCREAKSIGIPLEINLLGLVQGRNYPDLRFWEIAAEEGCAAILGCDAHSPLAFGDKETEAKALEIVDRFGLTLSQTADLRSIR